VESQTPPGPTPTGPDSPSPKPSTPYISPRLREKLGDQPTYSRSGGGGPDYSDRHDDGPPAWLGIVLAVLVIGGGGALFWTINASTARDKAKAIADAKAARQAAVAESLAAVAHADSMRVAMAAADSINALTGHKKPAPKPAPAAPTAAKTPTAPAAGGATPPPAPAAAPAEQGPFGLDVGTFLVEDRANSEQQRIATATGLAGKVVTMSEDGSDVYHVIMGSFSTRSAADKKAAALVNAGQVNQARTVPLKK
jgi:cell division septation protein DedD